MTCEMLDEVFPAAASTHFNKKNIPVSSQCAMNLGTSSQLPQAPFVLASKHWSDFTICNRHGEVFPAAAGGFLLATGNTSCFLRHVISLVRSPQLPQTFFLLVKSVLPGLGQHAFVGNHSTCRGNTAFCMSIQGIQNMASPAQITITTRIASKLCQ